MLPNFLIAGVQKGGTTAIFAVLRKHPQIFMSEKKEVSFFWKDNLYSRGVAWYENYFRGCKGEKAVGEASPSYLYSTVAPERIARSLPNVKLIFSLRNPIDRAYSQYWHHRRRLVEGLSFEEAIARGDRGFLPRGFYYEQLMRYLNNFPRENILIQVYDDLKNDPHGFYKRCFEFLKVDDAFVCPEMGQIINHSPIPNNLAYRWLLEHPHLTSYLPRGRGRGLAMKPLRLGRTVSYPYPPMDPETRGRLVELFKGPNRHLGELLGRNLSSWNK